jgi:hypothetical protein
VRIAGVTVIRALTIVAPQHRTICTFASSLRMPGVGTALVRVGRSLSGAGDSRSRLRCGQRSGPAMTEACKARVSVKLPDCRNHGPADQTSCAWSNEARHDAENSAGAVCGSTRYTEAALGMQRRDPAAIPADMSRCPPRNPCATLGTWSNQHETIIPSAGPVSSHA